ncbi:MAG: hypothetical protein U0164_11515 [Gemmatimonadaceae bacterium]
MIQASGVDAPATASRSRGRGSRRPPMGVVRYFYGWRRARRAVLYLTVGSAIACAPPRPTRMHAVTVPVREVVQGEVAGSVAVDGEVLSLVVDSGWVQYRGGGGADGAPLDEVTMRAVVAIDSAGQPIPLGVSGAVAVADVLRAGERRALPRTTLAVPLPPGGRLRDLWLAVQFRGTLRPDGAEPSLVLALACSTSNVLGMTKQARQRTRRMQAGDATVCRM